MFPGRWLESESRYITELYNVKWHRSSSHSEGIACDMEGIRFMTNRLDKYYI
jgi:hypothetical protein